MQKSKTARSGKKVGKQTQKGNKGRVESGYDLLLLYMLTVLYVNIWTSLWTRRWRRKLHGGQDYKYWFLLNQSPGKLREEWSCAPQLQRKPEPLWRACFSSCVMQDPRRIKNEANKLLLSLKEKNNRQEVSRDWEIMRGFPLIPLALSVSVSFVWLSGVFALYMKQRRKPAFGVVKYIANTKENLFLKL